VPAGRCRIVVRTAQPNLGERASASLPATFAGIGLCFEGLRLVGIAINSRCERGAILILLPMGHVWIVDTLCGRFPGVDEHGLMYDPEHPGGHG
jgi:hypothetical protein